MLIAIALIAFLSGALPTPDTLPSCPAAERCAAIRLWVSPTTDFDDLAFATTQIEQANLHHGPAGLGFKVVEVPIEFVEREFGDSKMSRSIVIEALIRTSLWGVDHRLGQLAGFVRGALGGRKAG